MSISGIESQVALALLQGTLGAGGARQGPAPSQLPGEQQLAQVRVAIAAQAQGESVGQLVNSLA